jgi:hypothetical protein
MKLDNRRQNKMKLYEYSQNNTFGRFEGSTRVYVEAESISAANAIATNKFGVYFNGVAEGRDCDCCGDRWYSPYELSLSVLKESFKFCEEKDNGAWPIWSSSDNKIKYIKYVDE